LWQPKDDDDTTLGPIPMRQALYRSRNLATIKLGMALGEPTVIGEARRYGITTPLPPHPSIHIGATGVRPIELIAAYTAFANLGTRVEPVGVLRVEDHNGTILWQRGMRREPVMDPARTWLMVDMLKDVIRRGTAFTAVWNAGFTLPAAGEDGHHRRLHGRMVHWLHARARGRYLGRVRPAATHPRAQRGCRQDRRPGVDRVHAGCLLPPPRAASLGTARFARHRRSGLVERVSGHAVLPAGRAALGLVLSGH